MQRRKFLSFLGRSAILGLASSSGITLLNACKPTQNNKAPKLLKGSAPFKPIAPTNADNVVIAEGFEYHILIKQGDAISNTDTFGSDNDYNAFIPFDPKKPNDGLLWTNHECFQPLFISGWDGKTEHSRAQVDKEQYEVGGCIMRIKRNAQGKWEVVKNDPHNRRITAKTPIPMIWHEPIAGTNTAIGTLGNCAGGITPWRTVLTCEENYYLFYGETDYKNAKHIDSNFGWEKHYNYPPEHYGWVTEIDPFTGNAKKLIALGRCAHECATVYETKDKRAVVYMGDDANDQCIYKFISDKPGSLETGSLYVANITSGKWVSLNIAEQSILQQHFKSQTEVLIRLREAATLVGGTHLDRPEDIEIDPLTGHILITLTNNVPKGNYFGTILKIVEHSPDKCGTDFTASTFLTGGEETGFACPDNLAFDPNGNLWFVSDISGSSMNKGHYAPFKNNGLFFVPSSGSDAGKVLQVASAPTDAEFTGPFFSPDGKTLFLSVQHPGEYSPSLDKLSSHFPDGGNAMPHSALIAISGTALEAITSKG
jgi:secreted PhoX family phosphatase